MAQPSHALIPSAPVSESRPIRSALRACPLPALGGDALIVIPTYNERANLAALVEAVLRVAPAAELLIVDDGSPDGTGELADALAQRDARVHVLHRASKQGLGTAYVAGFRWGLAREYRRFVEMDADFSHDPGQLSRLLAPLDAGAALVVGSRNVPGGMISGWGIGRLLLSKGGSAYSRAVLGIKVRDLTTGYKAFTRAALEQLDLDSVRSNGYAFQIELTFRALREGLEVVEVPITFIDRRVGQSKMDRSIFFEAITVVWKLRLAARRQSA
ncbi:MAG TPA: polyprenol monophosphomannose synthase [Polyangiaceae bacterium]|nr:polyprenol monophosphomannose synthase [Polyangiaceae bacterium]